MMKKTVFLIGGFGNNLFQINKAYDLKDKGYSVTINDFFLKENYLSNFLGWSKHSTEMLENVTSDFSKNTHMSIFNFFSIIFIFFLKKLKFANLQSYNFISPFVTQVGYWQSDLILSDEFLLKLKNIYSKNNSKYKDKTSNYVVVHARLGDFTPNVRLNVSYFVNSIVKLGKKQVILVTDTPSFKEEINKMLLEIDDSFSLESSPGKNMAEDFFLMMSTENLVMSNSTFCYWASQINPVKTVIIPTERRPNVNWYFPMKNEHITTLDGYSSK